MKFMKVINALLFTMLFVLLCLSCTQKNNSISTTWKIDNLKNIGENEIEVLGDPKVIDTGKGRAVYFDGVDDGLLIKGSPIEGATSFTVEVVFRPDSSFPNNAEQRFVHIQNPENNDRRIMIETRLTEDHKWFVDTFVRSESSTRPLLAKDFQHPLGKWFNAALVYEKGMMKHYINGVEEMSGEVDFLPIEGAYVSLGVRMNKIFWFKGAIKTLRVTHRALSPKEFLDLGN